jgi:hypothetical protein
VASIAELEAAPFKVKFGTASGEEAMLYNYSQSTYQFRKIVSNLSTVIGIIVMIVLFAGFLVPVGKLQMSFVVQVCQIVYFSVFQFDQIPLTMSGFGDLSYSNGLNSLASQNDVNSNFPRFKLRSDLMFANYNLSFLILCMLPLGIGLISLLVLKLSGRATPQEKRVSDINSEK